MLPVIPLLCLAAAFGLADWTRRWPPVLICCVVVVLIYPSASASFKFSFLLRQKDTRILAAEWIERHIPSGSRIAFHGTDYGFPRVQPDSTWLRERYEDTLSAGLSSKRLFYRLNQPKISAQPSYYIFELKESKAAQFRSIVPYFTKDAWQKNDVQWIILVEHPIAQSINVRLWAELQQEGILVATFDPFMNATENQLIFDRLDAFYVPLADFDQVHRPGPKIYIYQSSRTMP